MKNPWTKKNPFMSMWLSGANSAMGSARGHGTAAAERELKKATSTATTVGTKQVLDFWGKSSSRRRPRAEGARHAELVDCKCGSRA